MALRTAPPSDFAKTVLRCELSSGTFVTPQGRVADNVKIQLSIGNLRKSPSVWFRSAVDGAAEPRPDILRLRGRCHASVTPRCRDFERPWEEVVRLDPSNIDDWLPAEHVPIVAKSLQAVLGRRGAN
jgi:hypothetical protein